MPVTPASHRPEALLYGMPVTPPASTESWWVGHPQEGFTAEAQARSASMSARDRGPGRRSGGRRAPDTPLEVAC